MVTIVVPMITLGIAIIGLITIVERRASQPMPSATGALLITDTFGRGGGDDTQHGLAGLPGGREWTERAGSWAISLGRAFVEAGSGAAVALVDGQLSGEAIAIKAVIGGSTSCGLVGRYVDAANYVALTRISATGAWTLTVVKEGEAQMLERLETQHVDGVTVQLGLRPGGICSSGHADDDVVPSARAGSLLGDHADPARRRPS